MIPMKVMSKLLLCVALLVFAGTSVFADDVISAADLFKAAKNDAEGTVRRYAGKPLSVQGILVSVGPDIHHLPSVGLSDRADGPVYVHCVLPEGDAANLEGLKAAQEITLRGRYLLFSTGEAFGNDEMVVLKQCEIVE